jgi:hypothetical protein
LLLAALFVMQAIQNMRLKKYNHQSVNASSYCAHFN